MKEEVLQLYLTIRQ